MSEPFLGEIRPFSFGFAPKGWAHCDGTLLPISQNQALFALLGTTYGGDGRTTFALPDLRGRASMHVSAPHPQGESGGAESITLTIAQIPPHSHPANCSNVPATQASPFGKFWAQDSDGNVVFNSTGNAGMASTAIGNAGGGQPHPNVQPYVVVNYCIALQGIFPSRN
ncbi:MAG: phage tail protein [Sterolibacteriaceae bacterium]|uniref:Phage tail protein n=1 Tax=Candidatus Methylophosphatis roskildensis TaxID=2899263 RepID=A0A9D7E8G7_9PROT|nr:phage tail protein [Candidatus Methylophosphatis roskildensis]MBK7237966.1 phage tail protein [Sterolibacteriaceae bacterium]